MSTGKDKKLLFFTADWCPPCKVVKKNRYVEQTQEALPDLQVSILDVDTEEGSSEAKKYGVQSIPTFIVINGDNVKSKVGLTSKDDLIKFCSE